MPHFSIKTHLKKAAATGLMLLCTSASAYSDNLGDALVGAYNHSGILSQNRALLRAADEDVAIAASALKSIVSWSAEVSRRFGDSTNGISGTRVNLESTTATLGLSATLQLFDFGADALRVDATKEAVLATRASLLSVEQSILLRAAAAYLNVIRAQEFVDLRRNNLRLLSEELRASRDRFEVGEVTRTDVSLAEAAVASARSNFSGAERDLASAQAEYRNIVGRAPGALEGLPALPSFETNRSAAERMAVRLHPSMAQAQHEISAAELLILAARADMNPVVSLNGSLNAQEELGSSGDSYQGQVGISVGGPIYRGGELSARERRAIAVRDSARGALHNVRHTIQQNVAVALADFSAAQASLRASDEQVRAARVAFQGVREEATLGARTTLDVLDAEQQLLDAQALRISAQADRYIAAYSALSAMGLLTAERLQLPVQLYDPTAYYNAVKDGPAKRSRQGRQLDRVIQSLDLDN